VVAAVYPLRFFRVVAPLPPLIGWTFLVVVATGTLVIARDPTRAAGAMVPILLLQLFAASSGFEVPARRGHYDLLLTSGYGRVWMALVHWGTSISHGIAAWLVLVLAERIASGGAETRLLAPGTWAAVALVSTLPWAITLRLPRFSGGIGWLLALAISTSMWPPAEFLVGSPADIEPLLSSAWGFLVYPPSLVGHELHLHEAIIAAPALTLACGSMVAACRWVSRASVPLEAAQ
jgi:hypothetical protein